MRARTTPASSPLDRLARLPLRLGRLKNEAALHAQIVAEAARLLRAQRVLLVLQTDGPASGIAASKLPAAEDATALLQAVRPWLEEARDSGVTRLRHGPDGAALADQRSCLVAPLPAPAGVLGCIYADVEGRCGRFEAAERSLLEVLASQAALALANLRTTAGLERAVAERTAAAEQRAGELAVVNAIQQAMASELDFQAIVDLVGDKLRELFQSEDLSVRWWDEPTDTWWTVYAVEHGAHLAKGPPRPVPRDEPAWALLHEGVGMFFGTRSEQLAAGMKGAAPGTDWCLSIMAAPIRGAQRVLGAIVIENHEREHAYGEADLRVMTTIGATMASLNH